MTTSTALPPQLLTVDDVAQICRVSPRTVRRMIAAGRLPFIRLGRAVRVHPSALAEVIAKSGQG